MRDYLDAYTAHPERLNPPLNIPQDTAPTASEPQASHDGPSPLARYATIGADNRVEVNHDLH